MFNLNKVELLGNISKIEIIEGKKGEYARFSIATNESYKDTDGNWQENANFHQLTSFNKHVIAKLKDKMAVGDMVFAEGKLQNNSTGEGEKRKFFTDILINQLGLVHRKKQAAED